MPNLRFLHSLWPPKSLCPTVFDRMSGGHEAANDSNSSRNTTTNNSSRVYNSHSLRDELDNARSAVVGGHRYKEMCNVSSSKLFLVQAMCIWILLTWPGVIVTIYLHFKGHTEDQDYDEFLATAENICSKPHYIRCGNTSSLLSFDDCISALKASYTNETSDDTSNCSFVPVDESFGIGQENNASARFFEDCHESRQEFSGLVSAAKFWIEGVGITIIGVFGVIGNIVTIIVLRRIKTNTNFNNLLIGLGVADLMLIIVLLIEVPVIQLVLKDEPDWYKLSLPYLIHPLRGFIQTLAIYMVVAVSAERFKAVCNPLVQRQAYYKFIVVAVLVSFTLEVPRFFEFRLHSNDTDYGTTDLMENTDYIQFSNYWNEIFATGSFPLISLCYMNFRIYRKIRASSRFAQSFVSASVTRRRRVSSKNEFVRNINGHAASHSYHERMTVGDDGENDSFLKSGKQLIRGRSLIHFKTDYDKRRSPEESTSALTYQTSISMKTMGLAAAAAHDNPNNPDGISKCSPSDDDAIGEDNVDLKRHQMSIKYIRKRREKSTLILVSIVVIFIICHTYRLSVKIYEVANPHGNTLENFRRCFTVGRYHIPIVFYVVVNVHHLMIVFNSSVNFLIYCFVSKEFRSEVYKWCLRR